MMHNRCSSSHNMVGPCSCGLFHSQSNSSLSMLFSSVHKPAAAAAADDENYDPYAYPNAYAYPYAYSPAAASVDCTLSLGTPSTRMSEDSSGDGRRGRGGGNGGGHERRSSISNFCWDILGQSKHAPSSQSHKGSARGGGSNSGSGSSSCSGDPLLARRCANCDTTSTPLWRNGPRGPKSLCNACGIRFKKEERRATAAAAATANVGSSGGMETSQQLYSHHSHYSSWGAAPAAAQQKVPCYGSEVRFIDDDGRDSDNGISFLSWRLNVTDRPSALVHDFTR